MKAVSIDQVADILDLHRSRIEQWISRGQFRPKVGSGQGKKREWTISEVIRLAVFARLATDVGLLPLQDRPLHPDMAEGLIAEEAGRLTELGMHGFKDDGAFFVCYKTDPEHGWWHDIVRKSHIAEFLTSGCFIPTLIPVSPRGSADTGSQLATGPATVAVLIDLDEIEQRVLAGWPADKEPSSQLKAV